MKIKQREMVECLGKGGGQMRRPNAEAKCGGQMRRPWGFPTKKKGGVGVSPKGGVGVEPPYIKLKYFFPKK